MHILNSLPPYNFGGIEEQDYKNAKVVILPIPYDSATSYKSGTRDGPHAIINASRNIEFYNEDLNINIQNQVGIYTTEEIAPNLNSPEDNIKNISKEIEIILSDNKIPFIIGGDHSVALGSIMAIASKNKDFSILHFDAHADRRDEFMGSKYSHASVIARANEVCDNIYSVGVRSIEEESAKKYKSNILFMKDIHKLKIKEIANLIIKNLKHKKIYLTFDFDVIDSSEMPSTGTPEPDGLHFYEIKEILRLILQKKELIGADFVELAPIPGLIAPDYLAAKLIYLTIGYAFGNKNKK
ncbi:MAG: agmatinase [Candidatus Micrarchaeia archaeon]